MPNQAPLQPGDPRRVGRYRLAGRITGIPSDGPIFLGTGPDSAEVMISMLQSDWATDGAARDRFAAEAAVAKRVPPFCAARILDAGIDGADAYLVSEYVAGKSLLEVVTATGVLSEAELDAVAIGMATGLASIHHAGLVHGNFGPEYVVMTAAGPRVVEFGITPPYGTATPAADMLAWAQTVVFAAAGRPAVKIADLDVLPSHLHNLVADCLSPDPSLRRAARAAVLEMLGEDAPPAGVLAEGSRRAVPGSDQLRLAPYLPSVAGLADSASAARTAPRRTDGSATGIRPGVPAGARANGNIAAEARTGTPAAASVQATGSRPAATTAGTGGRPVSRHSRGHEEPHGPHGGARTPGPPPDRHPARHQHHGRARRTWLAVAGAVVACAAIAVVVVQLAGGGGNKSLANGSHPHGTQPDGKRSPLPSPSVSLSATELTPASFAGAWSGQVHQPPNDTLHVTLALTSGEPSGTVSYSIAGVRTCRERVTLADATNQKLIFDQPRELGQSCSAGTVTITSTGVNAVYFSFHGGGLYATGTLRKS